MSVIPDTQFAAENARCQVQMTAIECFLMRFSPKFQSAVLHTRHLILAP